MEISSYSFSWPNFSSCFTSSLNTLSEYDQFTDITLICEKTKQLRAHKIILRACSYFFRDILESLPTPPTHLYLDGVSHQDLKNAIDFMYLGEVKIRKDNLNDFMKVCKKFQLSGLSESDESLLNFDELGNEGLESSELTGINEDVFDENEVSETDDLASAIISPNDGENRLEEVDENHKMFKPTRGSRGGTKSYKCKSCSYIGHYKHHMKYHVESKHLNIRYPCEICDYRSKHPSDLKKHQKFKHEKVHPYACDACPYKCFNKISLIKHRNSNRCSIKDGSNE